MNEKTIPTAAFVMSLGTPAIELRLPRRRTLSIRDLSKRLPRYAGLLWLLLALFILRVVGQMLVAFRGVTFLPRMDAWYSGLLPYPILLPVQIVIIVLFGLIAFDISRGSGRFSRPSTRAGVWLGGFSIVYAAAMALRYAITMTVRPERRWLGDGTIPIAFHFVLAAWLFALSRYHKTFAARQSRIPALKIVQVRKQMAS